MENPAPHLNPGYRLQVVPDPTDTDPSGFTQLTCPACGSEWISSHEPSFDADGSAVFTTIAFSCSHCEHRWELCISDRKGQVAVSYGPSDTP